MLQELEETYKGCAVHQFHHTSIFPQSSVSSTALGYVAIVQAFDHVAPRSFEKYNQFSRTK